MICTGGNATAGTDAADTADTVGAAVAAADDEGDGFLQHSQPVTDNITDASINGANAEPIQLFFVFI
jgi:hypothetical protein